MSSTDPHPTEELESPSNVLVFVRRRRADADRAEADVLVAAVTWAEQHPPESITLAATWPAGGYDTGLPLAGPGAPLVAEFCIAEFALAIGRSTDSGRTVIAHAVELKYRLPRLWAQVMSGRVASWRARRIAEATSALSMEAVAFVDQQVSGFAHKIGVAALDRLVEEVVDRFMPDRARERAEKAAEDRHVTFHHDQLSFNGTTHVEADLDLADALDFDAAITHGAESLRVCGSEDSLDVRRRWRSVTWRGGSSRSTSRTGFRQAQPTGWRASRVRMVPSGRSRDGWCSTCTSPTQRFVEPRTCTWPRSRTPAPESPPSRSGRGAVTRKPRWW